jgi:hypothetical protein
VRPVGNVVNRPLVACDKLPIRMRLGRMMLAGLAPLVGLSALAAAMVTGFDIRAVSSPASDSVPRLLHPVVTFPLSAAEDIATVAPSQHPAPKATLALAALSATPLRHSLHLVASVFAVNLLQRRHQRTLLRC